jgi:RNA polymerase sigma-70 factor (ECF subfamily)
MKESFQSKRLRGKGGEGMPSVEVPHRAGADDIERMMTLYGRTLLRMCYVYLCDMALAEDAVQDTFFKAYLHFGSFQGFSSEKTWLTQIAINTCKSILRKPWWKHIDRSKDFENLQLPASDTTPADGEVLRAVMYLPEKYRSVVLLYYYQELMTEEVAEILGIAPSTVLVRLKRAREKLKSQLEGWYFDE